MGNDVANIAKFAPVVSLVTPATQHSQNGDKVTVQSTDDKDRAGSDDISTPVSPEELNKAVKTGNAIFQAEQRELLMNFDYDAKKVVVKIVDRTTGEIIRQLPTKEVLNFVKQMQANVGSNGSLIKSNA